MGNEELYNQHKPSDAPPYDPKYDKYLPVLQSMASWEAYMAKETMMESVAGELANPCTVPDSPWNCPEAEALWRNIEYDDAMLRVYKLLVRNITQVCVLPGHQQWDDMDTFAWRNITTLIASAGYAHWAALSRIASNQFGFPYTSEETESEFHEIVRGAVEASKIPVSAVHMPYKKAIETDGDSYDYHVVRQAISMLHILKHCLVNPEGNQISVVYKGSSTGHSIREFAENLWNCTGRAGAVAQQLGIPRGSGNKKHPWEAVAHGLMRHLTPKNLVRQRSPVELPPCALYGPWTTVIPAPPASSFFRHDMQLTGSWQASMGSITPNAGDAEDALHTAWDVSDPHSQRNLDAKREFENAMPETYSAESPYRLFASAFPNLSLDNLDPEYAALLFDLPIYAELLRPYSPTLRREYPPIVFLPEDPTPEKSTNQGKSMATQCLASVVCPGITLIRTPDTNSAPDLRAIADVIRHHGTAALDEWRQPRTETHYFAHDNFQSLVTGGEVTAGRAYENSGSIKLSHSVIISTKWCDLPDDMINRCLFWFLGSLTAQQRENAATLQAVRSGRISLLMRLGAWADIEDNDFVTLLEKEPKASGALRFEGIEALARVMCRLRGLDYNEYCASVGRMRRRFQQHVHMGVDAGMNKVAATNLTFGLADLFAVGPERIEELAQYMKDPKRGGWGTTRTLLQSLLRIEGKSPDAPFSALVTVLGDEIKRKTNRQISQLVSKVLKARLRENEYRMLDDLRLAYQGWALVRGEDTSGAPKFRLTNTMHEPEWRETYGVTLAK